MHDLLITFGAFFFVISISLIHQQFDGSNASLVMLIVAIFICTIITITAMLSWIEHWKPTEFHYMIMETVLTFVFIITTFIILWYNTNFLDFLKGLTGWKIVAITLFITSYILLHFTLIYIRWKKLTNETLTEVNNGNNMNIKFEKLPQPQIETIYENVNFQDGSYNIINIEPYKNLRLEPE